MQEHTGSPQDFISEGAITPCAAAVSTHLWARQFSPPTPKADMPHMMCSCYAWDRATLVDTFSDGSLVVLIHEEVDCLWARPCQPILQDACAASGYCQLPSIKHTCDTTLLQQTPPTPGNKVPVHSHPKCWWYISSASTLGSTSLEQA
jgi:hypothetical protein